MKFMMVVVDEDWLTLSREAKKRNINVQMLIRAVMVPEWLESLRWSEDYRKRFKQSKSKKRVASMPPAKKR